jgi:hypothetical protein
MGPKGEPDTKTNWYWLSAARRTPTPTPTPPPHCSQFIIYLCRWYATLGIGQLKASLNMKWSWRYPYVYLYTTNISGIKFYHTICATQMWLLFIYRDITVCTGKCWPFLCTVYVHPCLTLTRATPHGLKHWRFVSWSRLQTCTSTEWMLEPIPITD